MIDQWDRYLIEMQIETHQEMGDSLSIEEIDELYESAEQDDETT